MQAPVCAMNASALSDQLLFVLLRRRLRQVLLGRLSICESVYALRNGIALGLGPVIVHLFADDAVSVDDGRGVLALADVRSELHRLAVGSSRGERYSRGRLIPPTG